MKRFVVAALLATLAFVTLGLNAAQPVPTPGSPLPAGAAKRIKFVEVAATTDTLRLVRQGGFTLYLRHGPTNNAIADHMPKVDLNDCSTQRPLTDVGRQLMAHVGASMRKAGIPVGEFRVSPMCRARESAQAAYPDLPAMVDPNLMVVANFTAAEKAPIIANTKRLLATPVAAGTNRLLLAHAPNLADLIGYFPKEGTLVIFRPHGDGFDYLASVTPTAWAGLLK